MICFTWLDKCWISFQLQIRWYMNFFVWLQNISCCKNVIHVLIMHPFPSPTQWTCNHCDEIHASVDWEISNCHFIFFNGIGHAKSDVVDESIPWKRHLRGWQNNCCQNTLVSHLFWYFFKNLNVPRHWIFLLLQTFGQEFASNGWCKRT